MQNSSPMVGVQKEKPCFFVFFNFLALIFPSGWRLFWRATGVCTCSFVAGGTLYSLCSPRAGVVIILEFDYKNNYSMRCLIQGKDFSEIYVFNQEFWIRYLSRTFESNRLRALLSLCSQLIQLRTSSKTALQTMCPRPAFRQQFVRPSPSAAHLSASAHPLTIWPLQPLLFII